MIPVSADQDTEANLELVSMDWANTCNFFN